MAVPTGIGACYRFDVQGEHAEAMCLAHFALGQYDRALAQAMTLNKQFPANQYFIAMLVPLCCLADPRYQQLVNYSWSRPSI